MLQALADHAQARLGGQRRDHAAHEAHGRVLQEAGRLAPFVAHDLAAGRILRGRGDPGQLQGQAVGDRHVAVVAVHPDGMFRGRGVHPLPGGELGTGEALVVPVPAQDPLALRERARGGGDPLGELLG